MPHPASPRRVLSRALLVASLIPLPSVVRAAPPRASAGRSRAAAAAAAAAPAPAGRKGGKKRGGKKKIELEEDFLVEGKLEKPSAFYVLRRSSVDYDWARLDAKFIPLVLESVQDPLF